MKQRKIAGKDFPVTDACAESIDRHFGENWPDLETVNHHRQGLLIASEDRELTDTEQAKLSACDAVTNMHSALKWLQGRDHTEVFEHLDQVHGNMLTLACGCKVQHMFDHNLRHEPEKLVLHPHFPKKVCDAHGHLKDFKEHYIAVTNSGR